MRSRNRSEYNHHWRATCIKLYVPQFATDKLHYWIKTKLPNNIMLLVTVIEDVSPQTLTLGEHLVRGLSDVARKRVTRVRTKKQLRQHLDKILG